MKPSKAEELSRRGAYITKNPLGGVDIELPPNVPPGSWDEFQWRYEDVLGRPRLRQDDAIFPIRARYGVDDYGFATFSKLESMVLLRMLYIFPHCRGCGAGRRVLKALTTGPPLVARVAPFRMRSSATTWNIEVEPTTVDPPDVIVSEQPEKTDDLLRLYQDCGWRQCLMAQHPDLTFATTCKVSLPGFLHLIED